MIALVNGRRGAQTGAALSFRGGSRLKQPAFAASVGTETTTTGEHTERFPAAAAAVHRLGTSSSAALRSHKS